MQVLCFQEVFNQPYFCPSQDAKWYVAAEAIPDGPTIRRMQEFAKKYAMVIVVPMYEEAMTGVYYNAAAVIDADGSYLGKYRKTHIPQVAGFWEKFFFKPGSSDYPVFQTRYCKLGVYICYDRHFPEGLARAGAERRRIYRQPLGDRRRALGIPVEARTARRRRRQRRLYRGDQPRRHEAPWNIGEFYGQSYFVNPRGQIEAIASRDKDELLVHDMNLDMIREVRNTWQFFRDRRPETYAVVDGDRLMSGRVHISFEFEAPLPALAMKARTS